MQSESRPATVGFPVIAQLCGPEAAEIEIHRWGAFILAIDGKGGNFA